MVVEDIAILLVSVLALSNASTWVVDNVDKLARFFRVENVAMGFIMLAVSTSLPELAVSVVSSSHGSGAIAAGNVFGSNIANILLLLGLGASIYGIKIRGSELRDIGLVLVITTAITAYILFNSMAQDKALNFAEGVFLLSLFIIYAWHAMRTRKPESASDNNISREDALNSFLIFGIGIIVVIVSSGFVVESAVRLAMSLGVAQSFIGATVISVGTSLPEITIGLQAIRRKNYGLALGDAIGSNMVNLTLVLGTASVLGHIHIQLPVFIAALLFAVVANIVLLYVAAVNRGLMKLGGLLFLALYAVYLILIFTLQLSEISG